MNDIFKKIKGKFGFGCLRLPMNGNEVNRNAFSEMIDTFMQAGFNYFDTAQTYIDGKSEAALHECLVERYPRESFVLTDKLSNSLFETEEDILPFFESQLKACGVEYFDFYFFHGLNSQYMPKFRKTHAFEIVNELKSQGKIRGIGMSFHDTPEVLDAILTELPQIEVVQIQFNYLDYDDPAIRSGECLDICRKHGKPVMVMEPIRGGNLVNLPKEAKEIFRAADASPAEYALRYAAGFDGIIAVLSGMSTNEQVIENTRIFQKAAPLNQEDTELLEKVRSVLRSCGLIPCTSCRYCVSGCPKNLSIPDLIACYNYKTVHNDWLAPHYYNKVHAPHGRKASDCIGCGRCEEICPQHLPIKALMQKIRSAFEA